MKKTFMLLAVLGLAAQVEARRYMMIGAHPDDCDILFGGTAIKLAQAGHVVKFVSASNGNSGHHAMDKAALATRRHGEAQAAKKVAGIDAYDVWDIDDCEVRSDLETRNRVIRAIRAFKPDVVITHRTSDYHTDHRHIAQAVLDAAYLVNVPLYCPDAPIPGKGIVFAHTYDPFTEPRAMRVDAAVEIDSVMARKLKTLDCHASQFYEWLRWERGFKDDDAKTWTWEQRKEWLLGIWGKRCAAMAAHGRDRLVETLGAQGASVKYAEVFELSPYGKKVTRDEFQKLFSE